MSRRMFLPALLVFGLAAVAACGDDDEPTSANEPTATATIPPIPEGISNDEPASLEAGTYRVVSGPWSIVEYTITVPEGWTGHSGWYLSKHEDGDESDVLGVYPVLVDEVYADPCVGSGGTTVAVGPEVNDLVGALQAQPGTVTSEPVELTIGGLPATRIDLEIRESTDLSSCNTPGLQIWFSEPSDKYFVLLPGNTARVFVVDVDGEPQVMLSWHGPATSDEDLGELQSVLDSIRFD